MNRSQTFLEHLYKEKELHKEHRNKHVLYKLLLTGSFFGLGQFSGASYPNNLFLYVVPFVAMVHDIYIIAEHYKVYRVGLFLRKLGDIHNSAVCPEEIVWEKFMIEHREKWAYKASLFYSALITVFSAVAIYLSGAKRVDEIYWTWVVLCIISLLVVFIVAASLRIKFVRLQEEDNTVLDFPKMNE